MAQSGPTVTLAAEDAALIAEGAAMAAASAPPLDAAGQPIPPVDYLDEAAQLVGLVCGSAEAIFSDSGLKFSEATRGKLAAAWAPVMEKYEATGAGIFGAYQAEVGAAIVTVPVILAARRVILGAKGKGAEAARPPETKPIAPLDLGGDGANY